MERRRVVRCAGSISQNTLNPANWEAIKPIIRDPIGTQPPAQIEDVTSKKTGVATDPSLSLSPRKGRRLPLFLFLSLFPIAMEEPTSEARTPGKCATGTKNWELENQPTNEQDGDFSYICDSR